MWIHEIACMDRLWVWKNKKIKKNKEREREAKLKKNKIRNYSPVDFLFRESNVRYLKSRNATLNFCNFKVCLLSAFSIGFPNLLVSFLFYFIPFRKKKGADLLVELFMLCAIFPVSYTTFLELLTRLMEGFVKGRNKICKTVDNIFFCISTVTRYKYLIRDEKIILCSTFQIMFYVLVFKLFLKFCHWKIFMFVIFFCYLWIIFFF